MLSALFGCSESLWRGIIFIQNLRHLFPFVLTIISSLEKTLLDQRSKHSFFLFGPVKNRQLNLFETNKLEHTSPWTWARYEFRNKLPVLIDLHNKNSYKLLAPNVTLPVNILGHKPQQQHDILKIPILLYLPVPHHPE